ncbi:molybdopterin molybdotransferase MoeA [Tahibacter amnicola]|uniref:Molybdopterin molybdenumtransferase n=1 Tax=Tahibacter amnicola TaxID=2976241 RepID=A0ABY6BN52_9GAMM|nr:gephyrin-like molybdotransferase Glp [Tahibacter amnicola]UXI70490.1 molybdopterin molybdotransferase MoeA [Tahibacter amnicola]
MIHVEAAQALIRDLCTRLPAESVPLGRALNRVLARDLHATDALPPFDNSAMDGFAVNCAGSVLRENAEFGVGGEIAAGDSARRCATGAIEIMTGAPMPEGCDAVIPVENVEITERDATGRALRIRLIKPACAGQHVRRAGEDIALGALALPSGSWIAPSQLMVLAGLGLPEVPVVRRPRVALLCTGRELVDDPGQSLAFGQIRNTNGPYLAARMAETAEVVCGETVTDDTGAFVRALDRALDQDVDVIVSTGAVSMGRYDFVPGVLRSMGATIYFHKVAMRPGKPLLFARLPGGQLYFGLPGNPVSSAIGLRFFVECAFRALLGLPAEKAWRLSLGHPVTKKAGVRLHQKAALAIRSGGAAVVQLLAGQESFRTLPMAAATVWAVLPESAEMLVEGDCIDVYAMEHTQSGLFAFDA